MTVQELRQFLEDKPADHKVVVSLTKDGYESTDLHDAVTMRLTESIPEGDYDLYYDGEHNVVVLFPDLGQSLGL